MAPARIYPSASTAAVATVAVRLKPASSSAGGVGRRGSRISSQRRSSSSLAQRRGEAMLSAGGLGDRVPRAPEQDLQAALVLAQDQARVASCIAVCRARQARGQAGRRATRRSGAGPEAQDGVRCGNAPCSGTSSNPVVEHDTLTERGPLSV